MESPAQPITRLQEIEARRLEVELEGEEKKQDNMWKSCCMTIDRRAVVYFSQLAVIAATLTFSFVQLSVGAENPAYYTSMISGCIGYLLPGPGFDRSEI